VTDSASIVVTTTETVIAPGAATRALTDPDASGDIYARLIATPTARAFATERGRKLSRAEVENLRSVLDR
jgi:hypothetical protein